MGDHSTPEDAGACPAHEPAGPREHRPTSRPRPLPGPDARPYVSTPATPRPVPRPRPVPGERPGRRRALAPQPVAVQVPEPDPAPRSAVVTKPPSGPTGAFDLGDPPSSAPGLIERTADFALSAAPSLLAVLDIGCGSGLLLDEIAMRVPYCERYIGVDPNPSALAAARRRPDPRIEYVHAEAADLPCADASIDLVLALRSLGLWRDPVAGLREMRRVLRSNGRIVIVERAGRGAAGRWNRRSLHDAAAPSGLRLSGSEVLARNRLGLPSVRGFVLNL